MSIWPVGTPHHSRRTWRYSVRNEQAVRVPSVRRAHQLKTQDKCTSSTPASFPPLPHSFSCPRLTASTRIHFTAGRNPHTLIPVSITYPCQSFLMRFLFAVVSALSTLSAFTTARPTDGAITAIKPRCDTCDDACPKNHFLYSAKKWCLPTGGLTPIPTIPDDLDCPFAWYYHPTLKFCVPKLPLFSITPVCWSRVFTHWNPTSHCCEKPAPVTPACPASQWYYSPRNSCLPTGGIIPQPACPSTISCPVNWYYHPGQKCCVPKNPTPTPSPTCTTSGFPNWNPITHCCEKPAEPTCPTGKWYYAPRKTCLPTGGIIPVPTCPSTIGCPANWYYHPDQKCCVPKNPTPTPNPTCTTVAFPNWNPSTHCCEKPAEPTCPAGQWYYTPRKCCLPTGGLIPVPTCPSTIACPANWYYHPSQKCCVPKNPTSTPNPTCTTITFPNWNPTTHCCEKPAEPTCPSGQWYYAPRKCCIPTGGIIPVPSCPSTIACPANWYYHPNQKCCVPKNPTPTPSPSCTTVAFPNWNQATHCCEKPALPTCPSGQWYYSPKSCCLPTGGIIPVPACPSTIACPADWYYHPDKKFCVPKNPTPTPNPTCTTTAFPKWNPTTYCCEKPAEPTCPSGQWYYAPRKSCLPTGGIIPVPTCPSTIACPANWYYHPTQKCCVPKNPTPTPNPTCTTVTFPNWNPTTHCCEKPALPTCPSGQWYYTPKSCCLPTGGIVPVPSCPSTIACPSNWYYHPDRKFCVPKNPSPTPNPTCTTTAFPNWNPTNHCCEKPAEPTCPSGQWYYPTRKCCLPTGGLTPEPNCPSTIACPASWYYHPGQKCCVPKHPTLTPNPTCTTGGFPNWNPTTQCCEQPTCSIGQWYYKRTQQCLTIGGPKILPACPNTIGCPVDWYYHSGHKFCVPKFSHQSSSPTCSTGIFRKWNADKQCCEHSGKRHATRDHLGHHSANKSRIVEHSD